MIRPPMTGQQAEALANFLVSLRPGQRHWTKTACYDALTAAATRHTNDAETIARAAIRAALTPTVITPQAIPQPGAHWESVDHTPTHEGNHVRKCKQCGGFHTPNTPHDPIALERTPDHRPHIEAARKALHNAKDKP